MTTISVNSESPDLKPAAEALAARLNLAYSEHTEGTDYQILLTTQGLALQKTNDTSTPLYLDFRNGKTNYRRLHTSLRRETLARAMGLKNHTAPKIVDATAGLGRDGFMLASLGFEITLLERSPIIYTLLEDAIKRASLDKEIAPIVQRLQLVQTDAIAWMEQVSEANRPDIIYLDPMFPARTKSALVKKDMRYFHDIVGEDNDSARLLPVALACAARRVVVKRPRLAEPLAAISPNFSQEGSSSRFDVYLTR
jgi:16S rRNA (guanine1516-N2)-methyltransferase